MGDEKRYCGSSGEKCDIHYMVEKTINDHKIRVDSIEDHNKESFAELNKNLTEFTLEVRTYMNTQQYKDREYEDVRKLTRSNTEDVQDVKSSLKLSINQQEKVSKSLDDLNETVKKLEKVILDKDDVSDIVRNTIARDMTQRNQRWFDSLPAKITAGVGVISLILLVLTKLVLMIAALIPVP